MSGINSLVNNLLQVIQNMETNDSGLGKQFTVGERLEAQVLSREGNNYLLQSGTRLFRAQSDLSFLIGERLFLLVLEQHDGQTVLKLQQPAGQELPEYGPDFYGNEAEDAAVLAKTVQQNTAQPKTVGNSASGNGTSANSQLRPQTQDSQLQQDISASQTRQPAANIQAKNDNTAAQLIGCRPGNSSNTPSQGQGQSSTITDRQSACQIFNLFKSPGKLTIKTGEAVPAQVEALAEGLMLIRTGQGMFTVRTSEPLPAGTELYLILLTSSGEDGTADVQLLVPQNSSDASPGGKEPDMTGRSAGIKAQLLTKQGGSIFNNQTVTATVQGKSGKYFLIRVGPDSFFLETETELQVGDKLQLLARKIEGNKIILQQTMTEKQEHRALQEQIRQLAAKYGFTSEKELSQLAEKLSRLPVDEKTGVRYLLDPNLHTAVIIPATQSEEHNTRIEVEEYRQVPGNQRIYEVNLDVKLAQLGSVEISLKMVEGRIYGRIWAENPATEALLWERYNELKEVAELLDIVPAAAGPLIPKDYDEIIDLKV